MDLSSICKTSPLYSFWTSKQNEKDTHERLLKVNKNNPSTYLFLKEPYKWENLYQSIIREIIKGDKSSIKGLKILLDMLSQTERRKTIQRLEINQLLDKDAIGILDEIDTINFSTKRNFFRFLRILVAIFTNPYGIEIKGEKKHSYEKIGSTIYFLRKKLTFS